ncbi:ABC transporter permease [Amycolatopsis alkalitolerans]|uniref:ABC transporter permease n=1 Tax=Amycolatopsis alkalitolerans TaxID=2547244 RepID=A0A5C4LZC1_9PSEU|nr:ABC transporter permease [Amycolatopsis alkalitolerans]TNC25154.1 ABC transporter permease [Amycolatopsis alkalitolerans]
MFPSETDGATRPAERLKDSSATRPHIPAPIRRARRRGTWRRTGIIGGRLVLLAALLVAWQLCSNARIVDPYFVSSPAGVANFLYDYVRSGALWTHLEVTLRETLIGFAIGSAGGIMAGLLLARFQVLDDLLDPFFVVVNSLPRVALAPLFLLWFGLGALSKIILAISLVFFILLVNTRVGMRNVDTDLVTVGKLLGGNEFQMFRSVLLPASLPAILAGLRLGIIYALLGAVVGEMIAAEAGIGQQLTYFSGTFQTAGVIGMLVVLAIIAAVLDALTVLAERRLLRWQKKGRM